MFLECQEGGELANVIAVTSVVLSLINLQLSVKKTGFVIKT